MRASAGENFREGSVQVGILGDQGKTVWGEMSGFGYFLGGNCPGGNKPGGTVLVVELSGRELSGGELSGGNCTGVNLPVTPLNMSSWIIVIKVKPPSSCTSICYIHNPLYSIYF